MDTVKNVGTHPVDLSDGRTIGPGETAEDVALGNAHNKDLLDQGHIAVLGGAEPSAEEAPLNAAETTTTSEARPNRGSVK